MSFDYDDNEPPDLMHDGGDEFYCCECGNECPPDEGMKYDGMCADCFRETTEDDRGMENDARERGDYDDEYPIDGVGFAEPGGRSALRAATRNNPRIHPCPSCGAKNVLTPADVARGYQCDRCADQEERGVP